MLILSGCLLGAVQIIAGVAIGLWLQRGAGTRFDARSDLHQAGEIAEQLRALADEMSSSAVVHRSQLEQASQQLQADATAGQTGLAELVTNIIGDIVHANQNLQSQLATAEGRLEQQAVEIKAHISRSMTDTLTGIPNRREFNVRLEERMNVWNRRQEVFCLLLVDVDHFKALNDKHGHQAGDAVLAALGKTLRSAVRCGDSVSRYGGEEFAILLPNTTLEQALEVGERVRTEVESQRVNHGGKSISVTISGGLAAIEKGDTAVKLIEKADEALYLAKALGRNQLHVHAACSSNAEIESVSRLAELVAAVDKECAGSAEENSITEAGSSLQRERISRKLTDACNELQRVVEARG